MASLSIFFLLFLTGALFWIDVFKNILSFFFIYREREKHPVSSLPCICVLFNVRFVAEFMLF